MNKSFKKYLRAILFSLALFQAAFVAVPQLALAVSPDQICEPDQGAGASNNINRCVHNIYLFTFAFVASVSVLMFVVAGYMYMTGDEKMIGRAKAIITRTLIAILLLLATFVILNTLDPNLTKVPDLKVQKLDCGAFNCKELPPLPTGNTPITAPKVPAGEFVVNGHQLSDNEKMWMNYIATNVVPNLKGDSLTKAAVVAWWSLREGNLDKSPPLFYSSCGANRPLGPLEACPKGTAWQVGLSSSQVYFDVNGVVRSTTTLEADAKSVFPDKTPEQVLAMAAEEAGYSASSSTGQGIVKATGNLEMAWLLHNSAVGFTVAYRDEVEPECIRPSTASQDCYGQQRYPAEKNFASDKQAMLQSIADIKEILTRLSGSN